DSHAGMEPCALQRLHLAGGPSAPRQDRRRLSPSASRLCRAPPPPARPSRRAEDAPPFERSLRLADGVRLRPVPAHHLWPRRLGSTSPTQTASATRRENPAERRQKQ